MSQNIQNRLNALQPYVIGVRFQGGLSIVDAVFTNGWTVPKSEVISSQKGEGDEVNYHMFFSQDDSIGLDEILDYIDKVIGLNIEREKKHELLKVKVKELQNIFRENPLSKLLTMKYTFAGEKLVEEMIEDELDVVDFDLGPMVQQIPKPQPKQQTKPQSEPKQQAKPQPEPQEQNVRRAPNGEIIPPLPPEDKGELQDDFQTFDLTGKEDVVRKNVNGKKIELPKKVKPAIELEEFEEPTNVTCKCGPEEVCPVCEEAKIGSY